jgi:hypothetical protein
MKRVLIDLFRRTDLFLPGLLLGFEGYAVFELLPQLLDALKDPGALDLAVGASILVLVFSQMELGKRLSMIPPGIALRDMIFGQSAAFAFFILSPESLWLIGSLIAWVVFSSGLMIAAGRWTLLDSDRSGSLIGNIGCLAGIIVGLACARLFPYQGWSFESLGVAGIILAVIGSLRIHFFAQPHEGYSTGGTLWFWRDLRRDPATLVMMAQSVAAGLLLGLLFFSGVQTGAALFGLATAAALLAGLAHRFNGELGARAGHLLAGVVLLVDAVFWQSLTIGTFVLSATAAVTVAGVRSGAWPPGLMITAAERMGLHQMCLGLGLALAGILLLRQEPPLYLLGGIGALLIGSAFLGGNGGKNERGMNYPMAE